MPLIMNSAAMCTVFTRVTEHNDIEGPLLGLK